MTHGKTPARSDHPFPRGAEHVLPVPDRTDRARLSQARPDTSKSFDPYNSGAFDKRQTWERVIRK